MIEEIDYVLRQEEIVNIKEINLENNFFDMQLITNQKIT